MLSGLIEGPWLSGKVTIFSVMGAKMAFKEMDIGKTVVSYWI